MSPLHIRIPFLRKSVTRLPCLSERLAPLQISTMASLLSRESPRQAPHEPSATSHRPTGETPRDRSGCFSVAIDVRVNGLTERHEVDSFAMSYEGVAPGRQSATSRICASMESE
nr:hypothetical protein CFP56_59645 [Quercus suber]